MSCSMPANATAIAIASTVATAMSTPPSTNAKRATLGVSDAITATAVSHKVRYNVESDRTTARLSPAGT